MIEIAFDWNSNTGNKKIKSKQETSSKTDETDLSFNNISTFVYMRQIEFIFYEGCHSQPAFLAHPLYYCLGSTGNAAIILATASFMRSSRLDLFSLTVFFPIPCQICFLVSASKTSTISVPTK